MDSQSLIAQARSGQPRAIARLISRIENDAPDLPQIMGQLSATAGSAHVIGVTGSPGVGKSTTTAALVGAYRARGAKVGVLAVDPSSPFSGGALLGDRVRMQQHATDDQVFIRSMASRGHLGGLAATTPQVLRVLDAAGFDVVVIETVGVGQSEIEIAATADTSLVLLAPGMGDGIQAAKAGILEIGDVFVVNKADRDGADSTAREIRHMLELGVRGHWLPPVIKTVASTGVGIDELVDAIESHRQWLHDSGERQARRLRRIGDEIIALTLTGVRKQLATMPAEVLAAAQRVLDGMSDPYAEAAALAAKLTT